LRVTIALDVPADLQPAVAGISSLTGLSQDQVAQRVCDVTIPRLFNGTLISEKETLLTTAALLQTFPELRSTFERLGFTEDMSLDEIMMAAQSAMLFLSVADQMMAPCSDCEDATGSLH
jgi:hypothetical protein